MTALSAACLLLLGVAGPATSPPPASPITPAPERPSEGKGSGVEATPPAAEPSPSSEESEAAEEAAEGPRSKKHAWLEEKEQAEEQKPGKPSRTAERPISLYNMWTKEILPVLPSQPPTRSELNRFLRCHYTDQATEMDPRLLPLLLKATRRFRATRVEIVSGFRSPKYNLLLRKKGREVARDSQHPKGEAIDFRLAQVPLRTLVRFVRSFRVGGVGMYLGSGFVHFDTRALGADEGGKGIIARMAKRVKLPFWTGH